MSYSLCLGLCSKGACPPECQCSPLHPALPVINAVRSEVVSGKPHIRRSVFNEGNWACGNGFLACVAPTVAEAWAMWERMQGRGA